MGAGQTISAVLVDGHPGAPELIDATHPEDGRFEPLAGQGGAGGSGSGGVAEVTLDAAAVRRSVQVQLRCAPLLA